MRNVKVNPAQVSQKTKELVIYIAEKLKDNPNYGAVLLNKALYYIDNVCYLKEYKTVSDFKYIRQQNGPTPKPNQFLALKQGLIDSGEMEEVKVDFFGKIQKRCVAKREADVSFFDENELVLIEQVLNNLADHNATSISNVTHGLMAWDFAGDKEELPFYTFMLSSAPPKESDIVWAKSQIALQKN